VLGGHPVLSDPNYNLDSVWPQDGQPAYIHQFTLVSEYALTNELSYHGQVGHQLADYRNGDQLAAQQAQGLRTSMELWSCNHSHGGPDARFQPRRRMRRYSVY